MLRDAITRPNGLRIPQGEFGFVNSWFPDKLSSANVDFVSVFAILKGVTILWMLAMQIQMAF